MGLNLSESVEPKRALFIAVVALLVVGGIGTGVWFLMRDEAKTGGQVSKEDFFCDKCLKKFTLTGRDPAAWDLDEETTAADQTASHRPHCPLCKAKHSGWVLGTCPKCEKSFVAAARGLPAAALPEGMVMAEAGNICPYCKADITGIERP